MPWYFLDTNAVVAGYSNNPEYIWMRGMLNKRQAKNFDRAFVISDLTTIEIASAVYALERNRQAPTGWVNWAIPAFLDHVATSRRERATARDNIVPITAAILRRAEQLVHHYRRGQPKALHTLDALQLACALSTHDLVAPVQHQASAIFVVTIDQQLAGCAADQVLRVIDPRHPPTP